jgi:nucleoid DNA-binding protein
MTKVDLIKYVSNKTMITEKDARIIIDVFMDGIKKGLENGNRVMIKDFGAFFLKKRVARTSVNPRNQEIVDVPAKTVIKFKSSRKMLDMVNK